MNCSYEEMMEGIYSLFFSNSSKMNKIKTIIEEVAKTDIAVLIKGESGTGKGLVAEAIHQNSHRSERPFIKVNCAAIPKGLLESELFGFEKGAFTGANQRRPGKFELANGGTILLNEIGEIDISIQPKLLQVLQDGAFSRLGGSGDIQVNTRVITATRDYLERSMAEGRFREDLFFRINVISMTLPPLRDRRGQIAPFTQYFFDLYKKKYGRTMPSLSSKTLNNLKEYRWPGNIRELENVIKRIVLFGQEELVLRELGPKHVQSGSAPDAIAHGFGNLPIETEDVDIKELRRRAATEVEREVILGALWKTHWNRKKAAKLVGVSYKTLLQRIQKYRLDRGSGLERDNDSRTIEEETR